MFYLKHVFGILTLQTGTILLSTLFVNLALCVSMVNVLSYEPDDPMPWIIVILFTSVMITIWVLAFISAFQETKLLATIATVLWTMYIVLWLGLVFLSIMGKQTKVICLEDRCPDAFWLLNVTFHKLEYKRIDPYVYSRVNNSRRSQYEREYTSQSDMHLIKNKSMRARKQKTKSTVTYVTLSNEKSERKIFDKIKSNEMNKKFNIKSKTSKTKRRTIVAVIISLLFFILMLFSWMILFSYRIEIQLQTNSSNDA